MDWRQTAYIVIGLFIGVILHEYMHGRVADWRGDSTARNAGRLTLNPIAHIDPFGTVLLPLALVVISGGRYSFGYAKPVPVNPFFLRRRRDMALVALAGPATNLAIALIVAMIGMLLNLFHVPKSSEVYQLLFYIAFINIWLAVFNMIPVPPLDGSHVLEIFLSHEAQVKYEKIAPFGFVIVFLVVFSVGWMFIRAMAPLLNLILKIMGSPFPNPFV